ncbi:MAG: hypothetical protein JSV27_08505 [Candidatus Bathyarchaeota archaeon]|nr:MAG: hypothetical protein JSV27_08505 [Candidatus Bathyarchaeota archaeon]
MKRREYPILEHDTAEEAVIEPSKVIEPIDIADNCVICFFQDVIDGLMAAGRAEKVHTFKSESGEHPIYEVEVARARSCSGSLRRPALKL